MTSMWNSNMAALLANLEAGQRRGLQRAVELIADESDDHVPSEGGELQASRKTGVEGNEAAIGYGYGPGDNGDLGVVAVVQHERMDYAHDDGTAKFLENATISKADEAAAVIAAEIRGAIG